MTKGELETVSASIDDITPHPKNVRQGDIGAISESLKAHGQYRAIVVQRSTGHILAGNHTYKAAKALDWKKISAHFIDCDDEKAMRILLADNRANDLATYDDAALAAVLTELNATDDGLAGTLFDGDALDDLIYKLETELNLDEPNPYTQKLDVPQYKIVGERPAVTELFDTTKKDELSKDIINADIPDDIKNLLLEASNRHTVFNYRKVAEFYPHASAEVQRLMEDSALIIIDSDHAIAKGFASFQQQLDTIMKEDES